MISKGHSRWSKTAAKKDTFTTTQRGRSSAQKYVKALWLFQLAAHNWRHLAGNCILCTFFVLRFLYFCPQNMSKSWKVAVLKKKHSIFSKTFGVYWSVHLYIFWSIKTSRIHQICNLNYNCQKYTHFLII